MDSSGEQDFPRKEPQIISQQKQCVPESVVQISGLSRQFLEFRLEDLFDSLDDALFSMAEHAAVSEDQHIYFDSLNYLRIQREGFIQRYLERFDERFLRFLSLLPGNKQTPQVDKNNKLHLEHDDVDLHMAQGNSVRRFTRKFSAPQANLLSQLNLILVESELANDSIPFFPDALCNNFQYAMKALETDYRASLMLWKHFESDVLADLPLLYESISCLLADSGYGSVYPEADISGAISQDDRLINFVSLLFEYIIDDHILPAAVRALLSRLQIPILKLARTDDLFFRQRTHPARRLLNGLATVGMELSDEAIERGDPVFSRMENIVDRLITQFDDDAGVFNVVFHDFEDSVLSLLSKEITDDSKTKQRKTPEKTKTLPETTQPERKLKQEPKQETKNTEEKLSKKQLQEKMMADAEEIVLQSPLDVRSCSRPSAPQSNVHADTSDRQLTLVSKLRKGQWVEFLGQNGGSLRCRLSAISKAGDRYIFENSQGMKVVEQSARELAQEIHDGTLKILEDDLLFDKALQSVLGNFKRR